MNPRSIGRRAFLKAGSGAAAAAIFRRSSFAGMIAASALASDPNRPQYHLLPAANWMNDPNGPIYWKGRYHMFYQYNPHDAVWGDMHWAHASSPDMLHWQHQPVALAPTPGGADEEGCFTGSAVDDNGVATLLYTGVKRASAAEATLRDGGNNFRETQCLATSNDSELNTWKKSAEPVIAAPPQGMAVTGFRDPCLWKEAYEWYMGVGSGIVGQGGCVLLYRSRDLKQWEYLHPLAGGESAGVNAKNPVDSGDMWECPDFFSLGAKHVLLHSTSGKVYWSSGDYDLKEHRFYPQLHGELDYGPHAYYAPKSMLDRSGKRILWGWIPETRTKEEYQRAGWAGLMSLPRVLSLGSDGRLEMHVISESSLLREGSPLHWKTGQHHATWPLKDLRAELALRTKASGEAVQIGISVSGGSKMKFRLDSQQGTLSWNGQTVGPSLSAGELELSLFLDGSVIEVFVNKRIAHTSRVYDLDAKATVLEITDPASAIHDASLWQIRPISKDRLTT
jgi:beta-fructofuranosidase